MSPDFRQLRDYDLKSGDISYTSGDRLFSPSLKTPVWGGRKSKLTNPTAPTQLVCLQLFYV